MNLIEEARLDAIKAQNFRQAKSTLRYAYRRDIVLGHLLCPYLVFESHRLLRINKLLNYCKKIGKNVINVRNKLIVAGCADNIAYSISQFS
tara:strand:+ start:565 stop:837 length:273 start_codon:yes stop_codon:yes gene_type:complete